jgi:hypothetical protein
MKPGIYPGLPMRDYLQIPAVSAGLLNTLTERCPRAAWHESWLNPKRPLEATTPAQGIGTAAHQALLEGSLDCIEVIQPHLYPNATGGGIPKGWTNPAIRAARDAAIAAGKVPLLPGEDEPIKAMVSAAQAYIDSLRESQPALCKALQPDGGESEITIVWQERDGTLCKIRPDRLSLDRHIAVNYKTTQASAEPDTWFRRQASTLGYPLASAFYRRGIAAACGVENPTEVWLVQEQAPPYLCSLVAMDPIGVDLARRRMLRALRTWSACASVDIWHGYPADVAYAETPTWEVQREEALGEPDNFTQLHDERAAA